MRLSPEESSVRSIRAVFIYFLEGVLVSMVGESLADYLVLASCRTYLYKK